MKKIFQIMAFVFMLMSASFANANDTDSLELSDYDVTGFYFRFNDYALNILKNNVSMKYSPIRIASLSNDDHNIFFTVCQSNFEMFESVPIIFKTIGPTTDIEEITVIYNTINSSKTDDLYINTFTNIFTTLGANDEELQFVLDGIRKNEADVIVIKCQAAGKTFHLSLDNRAENGVVNTSIRRN